MALGHLVNLAFGLPLKERPYFIGLQLIVWVLPIYLTYLNQLPLSNSWRLSLFLLFRTDFEGLSSSNYVKLTYLTKRQRQDILPISPSHVVDLLISVDLLFVRQVLVALGHVPAGFGLERLKLRRSVDNV